MVNPITQGLRTAITLSKGMTARNKSSQDHIAGKAFSDILRGVGRMNNASKANPTKSQPTGTNAQGGSNSKTDAGYQSAGRSALRQVADMIDRARMARNSGNRAAGPRNPQAPRTNGTTRQPPRNPQRPSETSRGAQYPQTDENRLRSISARLAETRTTAILPPTGCRRIPPTRDRTPAITEPLLPTPGTAIRTRTRATKTWHSYRGALRRGERRSPACTGTPLAVSPAVVHASRPGGTYRHPMPGTHTDARHGDAPHPQEPEGNSPQFEYFMSRNGRSVRFRLGGFNQGFEGTAEWTRKASNGDFHFAASGTGTHRSAHGSDRTPQVRFSLKVPSGTMHGITAFLFAGFVGWSIGYAARRSLGYGGDSNDNLSFSTAEHIRNSSERLSRL